MSAALRAALESAEEALTHSVPTGSITLEQFYTTLAKVRAALAEPVAEPVAEVLMHICQDHQGPIEALSYLTPGTKLYAAPQQAPAPAPIAQPIDERAAFEDWMGPDAFLARGTDDVYIDHRTGLYWNAWRARARLVSQAAPLAQQAPAVAPIRQPMTEDEAADVFKAWRSGSLYLHMVREAEKFHGIGGGK